MQYKITELSNYLSIPSVTTDQKSCGVIASELTKLMNSIGVKTRIITIKDSNPFILGEIGTGNNTILLYDHYDVMNPGSKELWESPPFSPNIRNGKLFARGVADNKANLLLRLQVVRDIFKKNPNLNLKVRFLIEGEEEMGSPNLHSLSNQYGKLWRNSKLCLWETGEVDENDRPLTYYGMKGIAYFTLTCTEGKKDIHSGFASLVDSAPWRLIQALSTLRDKDGFVTLDGINSKIQIPDSHEMSLIRNESWNPKQFLENLGRSKFLLHKQSKTKILKRHYFGITCNICGLWSGSTNSTEIKTVLPNTASAKIDFRLVDSIDSKTLYKYLKKHLSRRGFSDITVTEQLNEPVGKSDPYNPYLISAIKSIETSYKKPITIQPYTKGSGPIYYVASRFNIPVVMLGPSYSGSSIHGYNEHIRLSDYETAYKATTNLFLDVSKQHI